MASTILEQAGSVQFQGAPTAAQSDLGSGAIRTRVVDENLRADFTLHYPVATRATVAAVLQYCRDHRFGTFQFKVPDPNGDGLTIYAELLEPADVRRINAQLSSITVRLRRALLVDTD